MRDKIMPNDVVMHKPTGENIVVCGVNHEQGKLVACGYPFPSIMNTTDCEIIERNYENEYQSEEYINALKKEGLTSFIDPVSAMYLGII
jgi:hypothetical protein